MWRQKRDHIPPDRRAGARAPTDILFSVVLASGGAPERHNADYLWSSAISDDGFEHHYVHPTYHSAGGNPNAFPSVLT